MDRRNKIIEDEHAKLLGQLGEEGRNVALQTRESAATLSREVRDVGRYIDGLPHDAESVLTIKNTALAVSQTLQAARFEIFFQDFMVAEGAFLTLQLQTKCLAYF